MDSRGGMTSYLVEPGGSLNGVIKVPGDKSISHRAVMLGSLAEGVTGIEGFLEGEDAIATINAFRATGVKIDGPHRGRIRIEGVGLRGLRAPGGPIDCRNSGTSMRLLCGLLAAQPFASELIGDASLSRRPMQRVAQPLLAMGADIRTSANGCPPISIQPVPGLRGIDYMLPVASAQIKSALLLAGLYAEGITRITEPEVTRDHTERMLEAFGRPVLRSGDAVCIEGGGALTAASISIPADISSAAFFMVGAAIAPGSDLTLAGVGVNPTRTGAIDILRMMGADIALANERMAGAEPIADIRVRYAPLSGIEIPRQLVPLAIDEFPALFIAAANARGETVLRGAEELRVKESDRVAVMANGLSTLGITAEPTADGMRIVGGACDGGEIDSHGDHRIAMAFAIAALRASGRIVVRDCSNVATSFPGFAAVARQTGLNIGEE